MANCLKALFIVVASMVLIPPAGRALQGPPTGEIAAYSFDEGSGSVAIDYSGSGNNGTIIGATWSASGRYGGALAFDGVDDRVRCSDVTLAPAFTLMAWVFNPSNAAFESVVTIGSTRDLYLANGVVTFYDGSTDRAFAPAIPVNSWHHIALSSDGLALRAYVDGVQRGSTQTVSYGTVVDPLQFGAWLSGAGNSDFFSGRLDDARVYSRSLTQVEINSAMNTPVAPPANPTRLTISAPAPGATVNGTTVNVSYAISGSLNGVDHVHFRVDGGAVVMDLDADGSYQYRNVPVGSHLLAGIVARADHSEISGSDATVTFATALDPADAVPPLAAITAPGAGTSVSGVVNITADAADNVAIAGVHFYVDGTALPGADTVAPYVGTWNSATVADGPHTLRVLARDTAGNETLSANVNVTVSNTGGSPSQIGRWDAVVNWPMPPVNMVLMPTGNVLMWDQYGSGPQTRVWNPTTGGFGAAAMTSHIFCAGQALLSDGRVAVIGGQVDPCCDTGTRETNLFTPSSGTWARLADMAFARWYPTATTLPDGRLLAISGWIRPGQMADTPEVYDPTTGVWTALTAATLRNPMYSFMFVLPDGTVFNAGPDQATRKLNIATRTWSDVATSATTGHSAVMYGPGRIMKSGTVGDPANQLPSVNAITEVIDLNQPAPTWRQVAPMAFPRAYHNLVLLPDGAVLVIGGERTTNGGNVGQAVYEAELWDPSTETWRTVAAHQRPRMYHSTALLLPDGRVVMAGGDRGGYVESNAEIYSPPYLFKGLRPVVSSAPQTLAYGQSFNVNTPDASGIVRVSLIRLPATTHGFDQNQRYQSLTFVRNGLQLQVQAPSSANIAPPGHYMLFIVNATGVPSVASILRIAAVVDAAAPTPPGGLAATVNSGSITLSWTASTDNIGVVRYNVHRGTSSGFVPTAANLVAQPASPGYVDLALPPLTYYYVVTAEDAAGNISTPSNEASGVVPPTSDTTPPVRSNGGPGGTLPAGTTAATLSLTTNEAATCRYSTTPGTPYNSMASVFATTGGTAHSTPVSGLANGVTYNYYVRCRDGAGNANSTDFTISFSIGTAPAGGVLVAYAFNETAGTTALDRSGNGNNGTVAGGATWTTQGRYGGALSFDGVNDRVSGPALFLGTAFTYTAWIFNPSNSAYETIISVGRERDFFVRLGRLRFDTGVDRSFGGARITNNVWHHVAVVYDGTALRAYLDGNAYGNPVTVALAAYSGLLEVGSWNNGNSDFFSGRLDQIRVYNRALTVTEIGQDMNAPIQ